MKETHYHYLVIQSKLKDITTESKNNKHRTTEERDCVVGTERFALCVKLTVNMLQWEEDSLGIGMTS